jgi:hypothetical protein
MSSASQDDPNNRRVQIIAATLQLAELCLFDDDEDDPEMQLLNLFSSELFTSELVGIIGDRALHALSEYDTNSRKRSLIDIDNGGNTNDEAIVQQPPQRQKPLWNWERARQAVFDDYMKEVPTFNDRQFERMFRINRTVMQELRQYLGNEDDFFTDKVCIVTGKRLICPDVKILLSLKVLAYGTSPHAFIDYFQMGETTARRCFIRFANAISSCARLQQRFFRPMNRTDAQNVCALHKGQHGIEGMIGSLDCMHVYWKNCPVAWQGQYQGKEKYPTIVLEAMCDYNLYFWHHEFGAAGTLNAISIWDMSGLHKAFVDGTFTENCDFSYTIDGKTFDKLWVTVDGIYPKLSRFVKTLSQPVGKKQENYSKWQEATRKDVKRGFGVLQSKFRFLTQKVELWSAEDIVSVVDCSIILHNWMVTERLKRNEEESVDWYDCGENGDDVTTEVGGANGDDVGTNGDDVAENGDNVGTQNGEHDVGGNGPGNDGNNMVRNQNVAGNDNTNRAAVGSLAASCRNFVTDVSDPEHNAYQESCLRTREQLLNDRWMHLYDAENFYLLQQAIINELSRNNWNF